jgi:hypothetical protein
VKGGSDGSQLACIGCQIRAAELLIVQAELAETMESLKLALEVIDSFLDEM